MFEPIVGIIHNLKDNRYHPVYFRETPLPGGNQLDGCSRYKSGGHHTAGFDTREEAVTGAKELAEALKPHAIGNIHFSLDKDFPWDGNGIPAMVVFFKVEGENATPLF